LVHRRSPARLTGTKDISALIFDAVAGTTELLAILVVHHAASGLCTNDITALIRCAGRIELATDHLSILIRHTAALGEN